MAEHNQGGHGAVDSPYSNSHAGRAKSWLAVVIMIVGFCVSGVAMCIGPAWTLFWVGAAVIVVGGIVALVADIWNDVVIDPPRAMPDDPQRTVLGPAPAAGLRRGALPERHLAGTAED